MLLVLVYHRVSDEGEGFYTLSRAQFADQLRLLGQSGIAVVAPGDLPRGSVSGVLLSFDDGTAEHSQFLARMLEDHGMRGLFLVPTARIGKPGYVSRRELERMHQAGHVIGSHGHTHDRLDRMGGSRLAEELARSRQVLTSITGCPPEYVAPAGGFLTPRVASACGAAGYRVIRTLAWGYNRKLDKGLLQAVPVLPLMGPGAFAALLQGEHEALLRSLFAAKNAIRWLTPAYARVRNSLARTLLRNMGAQSQT
ncbi:MAG TPA: polysaccharide deacetylase family protein [Terriglobales bacterium]|jgi:peptidoglycan/xylan/chitin deacetylase (PgdA/CDA1 family)|nr:polysaccharide deacetylase family protein [Terriglobales bacterium]